MKLNFKEMAEEIKPHFNGGEGVFNAKIINDGTNKILMGRLEKGNSIGLHTHTGTSEIIYVISGVGTMLYDGGTEILTAGDVHYCPNGKAHSFRNENDEDLIFFAVVPTHEKN